LAGADGASSGNRSEADLAEVRVPDVRGQRPEIARQLLRLRELEAVEGQFFVATKNWRYDLTEGYVYLQTPRPLTRSAPGATVALWTFHRAPSSRPVTAVPEVIGRAGEQAGEDLKAAALPAMIVEVDEMPEGHNAKPGTVVDQYPRAGQKVYEGTSVLIHVFQPGE
jgi:beta-lactam-binding protein with PASTA domain